MTRTYKAIKYVVATANLDNMEFEEKEVILFQKPKDEEKEVRLALPDNYAFIKIESKEELEPETRYLDDQTFYEMSIKKPEPTKRKKSEESKEVE